MNILRLAAAGTALLIVGGCMDGQDTPGPTDPARSIEGRAAAVTASSARQVQVSGHFDAIVDFSTLTLTPRGSNCLLEVEGRLVFTGTIEGAATGKTGALVFAPCAEVATTPPGTYPDVFRSELVFEGTVDGEPASANVLYMGRVQPGGAIAGRLVFSNGVSGVLDAEAMVAVGGAYDGSVIVH